MTLSELKKLNPKAYEVFCEEILKQNDEDYLKKHIILNSEIINCCTWSDTSQKGDVWAPISHNKDFTLFNEWLTSQQNKENENNN